MRAAALTKVLMLALIAVRGGVVEVADVQAGALVQAVAAVSAGRHVALFLLVHCSPRRRGGDGGGVCEIRYVSRDLIQHLIWT